MKKIITTKQIIECCDNCSDELRTVGKWKGKKGIYCSLECLKKKE